MKALYRLKFNCGRQGCLEGIFVADKEDVKFLVENKISVYFGEALGKYSEIYGPVGQKEIKLITTKANVIEVVERYGLSTGCNPFGYNLCADGMEDVPDNGVDWNDCTVQEYIDFMRKGIVPEYYKEDYENWLKEN